MIATACPTQCNGGRADHQRGLGDGQLQRLDDAARAAVERDGGARRCSCCGAVHVRGGVVLGFLDNGVRGEGWHPMGPRA